MKYMILMLAALATVTPVHAQPVPAAAAQAAQASEATVRKIDVANAKITLSHGPIANLDMPPMTMVFHVLDVKQIEGLRPGQRVRFQAARRNGAYTVTHIEPLAP